MTLYRIPVLSVLLPPIFIVFLFFFSSRRRHTRCLSDWSSDVCSSDLGEPFLLTDQAAEIIEQVFVGLPKTRATASGVLDDILELLGQVGDGGGFLPKLRSEERRVGKECSGGRWAKELAKKNRMRNRGT